jgi:hypothetical protein
MGFFRAVVKFQQGDQGKGPFPEPGMGDFEQRGIMYDAATEQQYINVQGAFSPAPFGAPLPAVFFFYGLNQGEKVFGRGGVETFGNGIEKKALVFNIEGLRLVKGSGPETIQGQGKFLKGRFKHGTAVPEV